MAKSLAPDQGEDAGRELPFVHGKLGVPEPCFPVLHRPRVSALLDQATQHRVTLVSGPPGAGKTVACASWAAARPGAGQVIWLTADPDDRQDWFWAYVCAGLGQVRAAPADALHELADTAPGGFPLRLVEAAQAFTAPVVLIVDDVHEVTDAGVLNGLDMLIRHAPQPLRVVLLARRPPALQLARLRVSGALADVGPADLACTGEEAAAYFALLGIEVPPRELASVLTQTEGWMAGLRMAAMRAAPGKGPAGEVTGLAGAEPVVTDYVWDEVLGRQEPDTRAFLARTSVVGDVCGDLADALTGQPGGAARLARLSRENCLVAALDAGAGTYRYHPLLREVLTAELHRAFPDEVPALLRRAARWYARHGTALDCVRAAAAAQDWDLAAEALAGSAVDMLISAGPDELEPVLALFPAGRAADDAAVAAAWAATRLWREDAGAAAGYLTDAGRALERAAPATRRVLEPTLAALRIMQAAGQRQDDPAAACGGRAVAEAATAGASTRAEHRGAGLLWFALGCASLCRWDAGEAGHALRHADRHLLAGGPAGLWARARAWLAVAQACGGDLAAAQRAADAVLGRAPAARDASPLAMLACAQVSLGRNDLATAQRLLDEVDDARAGHLPGEPPVAAVAALIQARVLLADGDATAARAALARLRDSCAAACPGLSRAVVVAEAEAALRAGDPGQARALLLQADQVRPPRRADAALAAAGLLLAVGDFHGALRQAGPYLTGAAAGTTGERTRALLVAAVASRRLGDNTAAAAHSEQALALAEEQGAYRVFLDGGPAVRSALTVLVPPTSRHAGFAGRVLERFDSGTTRLGGPAAAASARLTDSERAVLSFLPSHMTNEEISGALFLSVNTVKTHLRSAYRKLGVGSRREAVARGRRLGLL